MTSNDRFAIYALAQGRTPDEQVKLDGWVLDYYGWIRAKIQEYRALNAAAFRSGYLIDGDAFDEWLKENSA